MSFANAWGNSWGSSGDSSGSIIVSGPIDVDVLSESASNISIADYSKKRVNVVSVNDIIVKKSNNSNIKVKVEEG